MRNCISTLTVVLVILLAAVFIGCRDGEEEEVVVATPTPTIKPQHETTPAPKKMPSPAAAESSTTTGQISETKGDTVSVKDQMGNTNTFKLSDPEVGAALKVGDNVAISIQKLESRLINETTGIVSVVTGNNLTVEDQVGSKYTFHVTDPKMMERMTPGSRVIIRVEKAEAQANAETTPNTEGTDVTPIPKATVAPTTTPMATTTPLPKTTPANTPTPTAVPKPQ
jgi:hypothetical protein